MNAIELDQVTFSYSGEAPVLSGARFQAEYGKITLLCGQSGAGKSTVLSLVCGIIPNLVEGTLSGRVLINGEDIQGKKLHEVCRSVGVVLQNADAQIVHASVEDELAFGAENFAIPPEVISGRIEDACVRMKLEKNWKTRSLSGGQKQRLMTGCILVTGQKILILDEPLANLDQEGAHQLLSALSYLAGKGYCILLVEHRLDLVSAYADAIWHLEKGVLHPVAERNALLRRDERIILPDAEAQAAGDVLFDLSHVAYSAAGRRILEDVSFCVRRGESILLLGENGCGKTTLLRLIAGLARPRGGTIAQKLLPGKRPGGKKWFQSVGVVYQNPNYQLFMPTVLQEVSYHAVSEEYAEQILRDFSLGHLKDRHPQSLSEGQKRRLTIAAVLAADPEVLLLDEPTVGQDYEALEELIALLSAWQKRRRGTLISVTHDRRCAEALCTHAILIEGGRVSEEGDAALARKYFFGMQL